MKFTKILIASITIAILLASCSSKIDTKPEQDTPVIENSDFTMKLEGYTFNLEQKLLKSVSSMDSLSECPIWNNNPDLELKNFRMYDVSGESADNQFIVPKHIAFCDFDTAEGRYVLILAQYNSPDLVNKALKNALQMDADNYVYLGLPTGLVLEDNKQLANFVIKEGSISTDDCGVTDPEVLDTGCPSGLASYMRVNQYLIILSQRFELNYNPTTNNKIVLEKLYS